MEERQARCAESVKLLRRRSSALETDWVARLQAQLESTWRKMPKEFAVHLPMLGTRQCLCDKHGPWAGSD